jgi:hypothetical protein
MRKEKQKKQHRRQHAFTAPTDPSLAAEQKNHAKENDISHNNS